MQYQQISSSQALAQRSARAQQWLRRMGAAIGHVPTHVWRSLVMLLLVLWLAHTLARLFWLAVPPPRIPAADISPNVVASASAPTGGRTVDIAALRELEVFGRSSGSAADTVVLEEPEVQTGPLIEEQAVDTQLRLVLRGVIGSSEEEEARAIIADSNRQKIYLVGDELPAGRRVTLAKVLDTRVILNNDGRYESLWLYQENPNLPTPRQTQVPVDTARSRSWSGEEDTGMEDISYAPATPSEQPTRGAVQRRQAPVSEEEIIAEASRTLSDVVRMNIHREGGQVMGYQISPGRDAQRFQALGLQSGDIVTSVNGMPLNNPGNIMEIYRNMSDATSATLEIRRGGQTVTVDVSLD